MSKANVFRLRLGGGPLILAQPHGGTELPAGLLARLNATGRALADTDWHITRLYDGLAADATVLSARFHRYLIDANRDPDGATLYPGQNTTGLCPLTDFDGAAIYRPGQEPSADEIAERRERYHRVYHAALAEQIERVRARHGVVVVYDCHSIRSEIPFLFAGTLPVFNVGSNEGRSCAAAVEKAVVEVCRAAGGYSLAVNGRFKGGWTTRHYGDPRNGVHLIQMELAQRAYMREAPPWSYQPALAKALRPHLAEILVRLELLFRR